MAVIDEHSAAALNTTPKTQLTAIDGILPLPKLLLHDDHKSLRFFRCCA